MNIRKQNDEVFFAEDWVIQVNSLDVQLLKKQANCNPRKRARLCIHKSTKELLHEMLIVLTCGSYIRPHKHLGKAESFHVIEGKVDVVLFDENGMIRGVIRMGEYSSGLAFYYRVSDPFYHTLLIRSDVLVFHEITIGPFNRTDNIFADWAPEEIDKNACANFISELSSKAEEYLLTLL